MRMHAYSRNCFPIPAMVMFLLVLLSSTLVLADTRYVSDRLIVSVRETPSDDSRIVGYLKSDTPVEVSQETERHYYIETAEGLKGWVRKKFITSDRPKALIIKEMQETIHVLEENIEARPTLETPAGDEEAAEAVRRCEQKMAEMENQFQEKTAELENRHEEQLAEREAMHARQLNQLKAALEKEKNMRRAQEETLAQLKTEYAACSSQAAAGGASDDGALAECRQRCASLEKKLSEQPPPAEKLFFNGSTKWFLSGGGMLLLGLLIGRSVKRKRSYRL